MISNPVTQKCCYWFSGLTQGAQVMRYKVEWVEDDSRHVKTFSTWNEAHDFASRLDDGGGTHIFILAVATGELLWASR